VHTDWPVTYLAAMHEVTAATFIVASIAPLLFPALDEHGGFNYGAEVGIASICMIMGSFNVGLAWRYWWLSSARSNFLDAPPTLASRFKKFTVIMVALSSNMALCFWLIHNKTSPTMPAILPVWRVRSIETLIFCLYAISLYGAYLGNLLEAEDGSRSESVKTKANVFAGMYGLTVLIVGCADIYYLLMDIYNEDVAGPQLYRPVAHVFWAACLLLAYSFSPPEQPLETTIDIVPASEVDKHDESIGQSPRNCNCPSCFEYFTFVKLLNAPIQSRIIYPRNFIGAIHEVFGLTLLITWGLTLSIPTLRPQVFEHPAKKIIGSFNPCFGWDYFPASWISVFCCAFNVYLSYRYAWLAGLRRALLQSAGHTTWASTFSTSTAYALGLSSNIWLCLWILGPNPADPPGLDLDGPEIFWWSVHTGIFVFQASAEYLTYLSLLLSVHCSTRSETVTTMQKVFAAVYGYCCVYLVFVYGYNLAFHEVDSGMPALGSGFWTQAADVVWMACVICISSFLPQEPPLREKLDVPQIRSPLDQEPE